MIIEQTLFVITFLLPWIILMAGVKFFHGKHKLLLAIASVLLVYAAGMLQVHFIDVRIEEELHAFDLDGDGGFSAAEINPAQEAAMAAFANDTARAMAPITGAIFSVLYTSVVFIIWFSASWIWARYRVKRI